MVFSFLKDKWSCNWGVRLKNFSQMVGVNSGDLAHLQAFGIQHMLSCPHTSEQSGLIERRHRQITETGLVLLAQALLPL